MGRLFDRMNKIEGNLTEIDKYLIEKGFYDGEMNPQFVDGIGYDELKIGRPAFCYEMTVKEDYLRIYVNEIDIYFEVETSWGGYSKSRRYDSKDYEKVKEMDELLDEILEEIIN